MPVYNEEACINRVVQSWHDELSLLEIDFQMIVMNDGSKDRTGDELARFNGYERIEIINKANSGHGPSILVGYGKALNIAEWVFQTDSDDEMSPLHFNLLWGKRDNYGALFGIRSNREQALGRKFLSMVSRLVVNSIYGKGIRDVNVPYRLMRSSLLSKIILHVPPNSFAPNLLIAGSLIALKAGIYNHPIPHEGRKTGKVSIVRWRLWKAAMLAFWQSCQFRQQLKLIKQQAQTGTGRFVAW